VQQRLIFFRDISDAALPAVRAFDSTGRNISIFPLRDFPGSKWIDIWEAKGSPTGDIVITAIVGYDPRHSKPPGPVKSLVLTYDSSGTLREAWDVKPYHHHHIAIDSSGNVFALGDKGRGSADYPLLIKYSPRGEVLGAFLSSSMFSDKDKLAGSNSSNGESRLIVTGDRLFVYIAATEEMFTFSRDGTLSARTTLVGAIRQISESSAASTTHISELGVDSNQSIICQVRVFPQDESKPVLVALARISPDGSSGTLMVQPSKEEGMHRFLGLTSLDSLVYLEPQGRLSVREQ
jgi:hypothetical protein